MLHTASPSNSLKIDLAHTTKCWKDAHALLIPMLADYLDSAVCLERTILHSTNQSDRSGLAQALFDADKSLPSLDLGTLQLQSARTILTHLRNQYAVLSPVNRLPTEVLTHISTLTTTCTLNLSASYSDISRFTIGSISSVCSY
ncbi:hypothetical protein BDV93DRAFT_206167 [Ceratobasidium sp. AG-I]|nr:hypothetical protein BDV93DRAFT_206167 [Ceratobasidium sp. AG-I]